MAEGFITRTKVKCPYCGIENIVLIYVKDLYGKITTYCDVDDGGCDEQFAFSVDFEIKTQVFKFVKAES